jgi:prevent-host-death family protein
MNEMTEIGVKELKARASAIVRAVREDQVEYVITLRGRPAALLLPIGASLHELQALSAGEEATWAALEQLGEQLAKAWRSPEHSTTLISGMRR